MKYTFLGFSQQAIINLGLDDKEVVLLRWFVDFTAGNKKISKRIFNNEVYYWVKYEAVMEEYPMFNFKKDTIYRKLKSLANKGVLKHKTLKEGGVWSYYCLGDRYLELITDTKIEAEEAQEEVGNKSEPFGNKSEQNGKISESNGKNPGTKNPSTISIYKKEKDKKEKSSSLDELVNAYTENNDLIEALKDFMKMRKAIKKPLTDRAMKSILKKLDSLGKNDNEKIALLEQSILNCWQSIFPLKEEFKNTVPADKKESKQYKVILKEDM